MQETVRRKRGKRRKWMVREVWVAEGIRTSKGIVVLVVIRHHVDVCRREKQRLKKPLGGRESYSYIQ